MANRPSWSGIHEGGMIDIWNLRSRSRDQIDIGSSILALAVHPSQEIAVGTRVGPT